MDIGEALQKSLQEGLAVRRTAWKSGMFVFHTVSNVVNKEFVPRMVSFPTHVKEILSREGKDITFNTSITAYIDGIMHPGYIPSNEDAMEDDWEVVD